MKAQQAIFIPCIVAIAFAGGCIAVVAGVGAAGTVAYVRGALESTEAANMDAVYKATETAVKKLELFVVEKKKDAMTAIITARDAEDKKITIKLSSETGRTTKLSIRVGTFGNEAKSQRIYEEIKKYL